GPAAAPRIGPCRTRASSSLEWTPASPPGSNGPSASAVSCVARRVTSSDQRRVISTGYRWRADLGGSSALASGLDAIIERRRVAARAGAADLWHGAASGVAVRDAVAAR